MRMRIAHPVVTGNQNERFFKAIRLLQNMDEVPNYGIYLSISLNDFWCSYGLNGVKGHQLQEKRMPQTFPLFLLTAL